MAATFDADLRGTRCWKSVFAHFSRKFPMMCTHHPPRRLNMPIGNLWQFRWNLGDSAHNLPDWPPPRSSELPQGRNWACLVHWGLPEPGAALTQKGRAASFLWKWRKAGHVLATVMTTGAGVCHNPALRLDHNRRHFCPSTFSSFDIFVLRHCISTGSLATHIHPPVL